MSGDVNMLSWLGRNFYKSLSLCTSYELVFCEKSDYFDILKKLTAFSVSSFRPNILDFSCWENDKNMFYLYFYINLNDNTFLLFFRINSGTVLRSISNHFLSLN